jgi:hypothetical protein
MNLDIRLPIGFMFGLFGVILTVYGRFSNPQIYDRSLGINVNLEWGVALIVFAAAMLLLGWRASARTRTQR